MFWFRKFHPGLLDAERADAVGLVAVGGDLRPEWLLKAYRSGIFPWYSEGEPILWWSPDPRTVLFPADLHIGRNLRRTLRRGPFEIKADTAFARVIQRCSEPRPDQAGTENDAANPADVQNTPAGKALRHSWKEKPKGIAAGVGEK